MAPPPYTPQPRNERAAREPFTFKEEHTADSPGSDVVASASICLSTWLIIGGVAYSPEFNDSLLGILVFTICLMAQLSGTITALIFIENSSQNKGKMMFAAGTFGFSITFLFSLMMGRPADERMMFWSLAGMYLGWMAEVFMGGFASLASRIDRSSTSQ